MLPDRQILDSLPVALARVSQGGVLLYVNAAFAVLFRADAALLIGRHVTEVTDSADHEITRTTIDRTVRDGRDVRVVKRYRRDNGELFWGGVTLGPRDPDGTQWVRLEPLTVPTGPDGDLESLLTLTAVAVGATHVALVEDLGSHLALLTGRVDSDLAAMAYSEVSHDRRTVLNAVLKAGAPAYWKTVEELHSRYPNAAGESFMADANSGVVLPLMAQAGGVIGAVAFAWESPGAHRDDLPNLHLAAQRLAVAITARSHHRALSEAHEETAALATRFQAVVEGLDEGVVLWEGVDPPRVRTMNPAARQILGCEDDAAVAALAFADVDGQPCVPGFLAHQALSASDAAVEQVVTLPVGEQTRWLRTRAKLAEVGSAVTAVTIVSDITAGRHAETLMRHRMFHDPLTGLANRSLLMDRLTQAIQRLDRGSHHLGVMFLDLDRFKKVNDTLGHDAGDRVLSEVARMLKAAVRPEDTVARLGGDEFVLVCEVESADALWVLADRLQACARPVIVGDREVPVSYSIGLALAAGPGSDPAGLIKDADAAMYRAKQRGRGRSQMFSEDSRAEALDRLAVEADLVRGLGAGEVVPYFQSICDLRSGRTVGAEVLARWRRADGVWLPSTFLKVAEDADVMVDLGNQVTVAALEAMAEGSDVNGALALHVNCSAVELATIDYAARLDRMLGARGIDPALIVIEVTEQALESGVRSILGQLRNLHALGVRIALDHFGTGPSSLTHLQSTPVSLVKVDRSFVGGLPADTEQTAIVRGIIGMAHALGLKTVAVGVETEGQRQWLDENGCDQGQGFLLHGPGPKLNPLVLR